MNEEATMNHHEPTPHAFVLHFSRLLGIGPALSFPCDAAGRVDLDNLGDRARCNYLYARAVIGREYAMPAVQPGPFE
jgi:hypothetical protein